MNDLDDNNRELRTILANREAAQILHGTLICRIAGITINENKSSDNTNTSLMGSKPVSDGSIEIKQAGGTVTDNLSLDLDNLVLNEDDTRRPSKGVSKKSSARKEYKCKKCKQHFKNFTSLMKHVKLHAARLHTCHCCSAQFSSNSDLQFHFVRHVTEQSHQCEICCKFFAHQSSLTAHKFVHSWEQPYICRVCQETFSCGPELYVHSAIHRSTNKHRCELCLPYYCNKYRFIIHCGNSIDDEPFLCKYCYMSFSSCENLLTHERQHYVFNAFSCAICLKLFLNARQYKEHAKIHEGVVPHCLFCTEYFEDTKSLLEHYSVHMGEEPHQCNLCAKYFPYGLLLLAHSIGRNGVCKV